MSGDVDPEDKTEEPTEKRLHDAVERGEVAFSREAPLFASLSAALLVLIFVIPTRAEALLTALIGLIDEPAGWRIERGEDVLALAGPLVDAGVHFLLPTIILLTVAGVLASLAQSTPRIVPDRILPDPSRISLRKGLSRVFGARGWTEFLKRLIKLGAVIATALSGSPIWCRRFHRISKQEVKEDLRQAEGDRIIKARLRSLRLDRSRRRMLSAVPRATMVVVNPTHYAVALRYVRAEGGAPMVVAKGADFIALKIRSIAEDHAIPVVEDKPLAPRDPRYPGGGKKAARTLALCRRRCRSPNSG